MPAESGVRAHAPAAVTSDGAPPSSGIRLVDEADVRRRSNYAPVPERYLPPAESYTPVRERYPMPTADPSSWQAQAQAHLNAQAQTPALAYERPPERAAFGGVAQTATAQRTESLASPAGAAATELASFRDRLARTDPDLAQDYQALLGRLSYPAVATPPPSPTPPAASTPPSRAAISVARHHRCPRPTGSGGQGLRQRPAGNDCIWDVRRLPASAYVDRRPARGRAGARDRHQWLDAGG